MRKISKSYLASGTCTTDASDIIVDVQMKFKKVSLVPMSSAAKSTAVKAL
jgi:hypothetical protein